MYFLKITFVRKIICYLRYIFFVHIFKKYIFLSQTKSQNLEPEKNFGQIYYNNDKKIDNQPKNYLNNIRKYESYNLFKNPFSIKNLSKFDGARSNLLINPLLSCSYIDKKKSRILSIGPRTEGEIFNIISKGFLKKNITSIDLQTYSPLIQLGDMHEMNFDSNTFDLVLCGWVMTYSYNRQKAINEIIRVCKNDAIVCIGSSFHKETHVSNLEIKKYLESNLKKVLFEINPDDFPTNHQGTRHSIINFTVKK